jgi:hypothetical protein
MFQHPAITISRSLGSMGASVGAAVARELGWQVCAHRVLELAATATVHSATRLAWQEEHRWGFLQNLQTVAAMGSPEAPYAPPLNLPLDIRELYASEKTVMREMLRSAPGVIIGHAGFNALAGRPATLHVAIRSAMSFRVQTLVTRGIASEPRAAMKAIMASDRDRAALIRDIAGLDWNNPNHFHLTLDVAPIGVEACAKRIMDEWLRHFSSGGATTESGLQEEDP